MSNYDIISVVATWTTPLSDEFWSRLESLNAVATEQSDQEGQGNTIVLGPTLPDDDDPRVAHAAAHSHKEDNEVHWGLSVQPTPQGEPPEEARKQHEKLGGRKGLASLFTEALPSGLPAVGSFRLRLSFAEDRFACAVIPAILEKGSIHDAALHLGRGARLEQVGYRFEGGGASGIEEITLMYEHSKQRFVATVLATGPLKFGSPRWLTFADDIGELVQNTFFSPR
ncbi:hypothetical protein [Sorangium sp. So ce1097]|uniref:hypothetical protein n=1 Tax=Sorangium sp. So ce1097 TaxID=3133330 RepID=UPI003F5D8CE5